MPPAATQTGSLELARQRYLENLAALYLRHPDLAARLESIPFTTLPPLEPSRSGPPTMQITADDGRPLWLHSRYDPPAEAATWAGHLPNSDTPAFVIGGLGLGYHLAALEQRFRKPLLVVLEDDLVILKAALCVTDFAAAIRERRLVFITTAEKSALHQALAPFTADLLIGMQIAVLPHARRCRVEFQQRAQSLITDFIAYSRLQMVTLLKVSRETLRNISFNLPAYLKNPGIDALRARAAGYPAVLIAAGPSLARHLPLLTALKNRAVLIGVQTVLKLMHRLGAAPHFVTSLDFHEVSAEFFEGLPDAGDCILVAEPKATWRVLDLYPGRKHLLGHDLYARLLREANPPRARLKAGSTVAHLAFYLAEYLGCDPIILVGQDLCFSQGLFYPPGTPIEDVWWPELGRFQTVEMKHWERIVRNRPILRRITDIAGQPAYTDDLLFSYAEQFQADFERCAARVIHAGEAGMPLRGTTVMSLADAADQFCTRELPADLFRVELDRPPQRDAIVAALEQRLAELERVHGIAREMRRLLEQLQSLTSRPAEFNRVVARVDELRLLITEHEDIYQTVTDVSQTAELRRYSADRRLGEIEQETAETAGRRIRRDIEFVDAFLDGCDYLTRTLPAALARVTEQLR